MTWAQAFSQLDSVRDELEMARFALSLAQKAIHSGVRIDDRHLINPTNIRLCTANLEWTYSLRLFTDFEGVLRDYWGTAQRSPLPRRTRMEVLINRVAARCSVPYDLLQDAHEVREQRNAIVHGSQGEQEITFYECKTRLGKFLSYLPVRW